MSDKDSKGELKPCPFCGSEALLDKRSGWFHVLCSKCMVFGINNSTKHEAVKWWNTRPITPKEDKREKWISVKKRMPELNKSVLCYFVTRNHPVAGCSKVHESYLYKMSNCDIKAFSDESMYSVVTHWKPLPSPPIQDQTIQEGN